MIAKRFFLFLATALLIMGCGKKPQTQVEEIIEAEEENDSTLYGVCGEGTMMHTLQLVTGMKDTLEINLIDEDTDCATLVAGGLMAGDRMAVTAHKTDDGLVAQRVVNITSLLGKWSSIDKNFELMEEGEVKSYVKAETNTWTAWRILNGQLLLNRDTFDIITLGADSLEMENANGIFLFRRIPAEVKAVEELSE